MLTLVITQNTSVFSPLPYPFSNVVLLRFKRTPFRLQKESFCSAKRTLLKTKRTPFGKPLFNGQKITGSLPLRLRPRLYIAAICSVSTTGHIKAITSIGIYLFEQLFAFRLPLHVLRARLRWLRRRLRIRWGQTWVVRA